MKSSKYRAPSFFRPGVSLMMLIYLARAYLEPGASSFILKIIISGLAGLGIIFRFVWGFFRAIFSKPVAAEQPGESKDDPEDS